MSDDLMIAHQLGLHDMRSRLHKQADEIERLRAENEKLRAALKPFADEASVGPMPGQPYDPRRCSMKFLRAAAAAIRENGDE